MAREKATRAYDLQERLMAFACMVIDVVESVRGTRAGNHVAGQLIRCGTSPAANYAEAIGGESRKDFLHKLKIVHKELRESLIWLHITDRRSLCAKPALVSTALEECQELVRITKASIRTTEKGTE